MKNDIAIKVENLSKCFRVGAKEENADSFGGMIANALRNPIDNYRKYKSLYKFDDLDLSRNSEKRITDESIMWALRDINFEVPQGQVMGIVGGNGAGKSTLLKVLSSITPPTQGRITIQGRVSSLLEVGTGFHQELTGRENVYLNGTMMGMTKQEVDQRFDAIVDFSGVEDFLDTPVKRYSSGMRVRLAFAVAAHLEPEVLIIDEVLAVGDSAFQRKSLDKMEDVSQQGRTVLFVSHNMPAITRLCTRAILINEGRMVKDGSATDVVSAYLNDGHGINPEIEWNEKDSPGDDVAKLNRVRVKDTQGKTTREVDCQHGFGLEMEYEVLRGGEALMPYFVAWNENGMKLFIVVETDPSWMGKVRPPGRYVTTAWVDGNILGEGIIHFSAHMKTVTPEQLHFHAHQVVAVQMVDSLAAGSARGPFAGTLDGAFRPKLNWETETFGAKASNANNG